MIDKVGSVLPSEREISEVVAEVEALRERIARYTVTLSREERQATTKFRPGGDGVVATVGDLARRTGLALPGVSVDAMHADLTLARRLAPLAAAVDGLQRTLDDTILEAQSECWWAATAIYSALVRLSANDATLEAALRPVVEFFATGRRKRRDPAPEPR